jgi:rubredoxin
MAIVELDPEIAWKAIEGYQNELEPAQKALEAFYRQFRCPRCGGSCRKEILANHAFADPDTLVARSVLRCNSCECLFDPHSGLRLEMGHPERVPPDIPIIIPNKE